MNPTSTTGRLPSSDPLTPSTKAATSSMGLLHQSEPDVAQLKDLPQRIRCPSSGMSTQLHKAHIKFPIDYPYSPPTFRFLTKMWHPNIYENGDVCISILHPPVDDPQSGELPSERWNPTQNVRTILLSVISLLNEPNTFSPANVDASVMFRKWRDSKGKDKEYAEIIRKQVSATKAEAEKDGVKVPTTLAEYCIKTKVPSNDNSSDLLYDDLYDDDIDDEDEEEEDADCYDDDDSGNEES
ncbi:ubiquitin-conjugating enzyme E2 R2 isoform X1 [Tursiops truncatus]|uniref:ubiquitin-conjugating enzyme E2 R2 isoform X1 n=1 Tax=Tursiops truncatus TaxID=9739 RepID=UPI0014422110